MKAYVSYYQAHADLSLTPLAELLLGATYVSRSDFRYLQQTFNQQKDYKWQKK